MMTKDDKADTNSCRPGNTALPSENLAVTPGMAYRGNRA